MKKEMIKTTITDKIWINEMCKTEVRSYLASTEKGNELYETSTAWITNEKGALHTKLSPKHKSIPQKSGKE